MREKPFIVACIPAYNEEKNIARVLVKTSNYVDAILVCDDGSTDMTGIIAERLGATLIRHKRNMGYGAAICTLWNEAKKLNPDILVMLDADGQHNPDEIPKLIKPIEEGKADLVIGSRFLGTSEGIPRYREFGIKMITKFVNKASGYNLSDQESGFRAYNRKAIEKIQPTEHGMGVIMEMIVKAAENNLRVVEVPVSLTYKDVRKSAVNPIRHAMEDILTTIKFVSIRYPILFYGIPGFIALILGLGLGIYTFNIYATARRLVTSLAVISTASVIAGLILTTTAIILYTIISIIRER